MSKNKSKQIFINYRRSLGKWQARSVAQYLRNAGYDVFLDVDTLTTGRFDTMILQEIEKRPNFISILTPNSLARCANPEDWVRQEIECAIVKNRHIIPLMFDSFDFKIESDFLVGQLTQLQYYNGLSVEHESFEQVMEKLIEGFLERTEYVFLEQATQKWKAGDFDTAIEYCSQAFEINVNFPEAFNRRGTVYADKDALWDALADFSHAIELNSTYADAYYNRGLAHHKIGVHKNDIDPFQNAISDYTKAIELEPTFPEAYHNRGIVYYYRNELKQAIADYSQTIDQNPNHVLAYWHRALANEKEKNYSTAIIDYQQYLNLGGGERYNNQEEIEESITKLKKEIHN